MATDKGTDLAVRVTANELRSLDSFEDAFALLAQKSGRGTMHATEELGDGFVKFPYDKDKLVGKLMLIVHVAFGSSDEYRENGEYVTFRFMTKDNKGVAQKYFISDGSTGIYAQLRDLMDRLDTEGTVFPGLAVPNGLRKSEYPTEDESGKKITGVTYYLDTSDVA